MNDAQRLELELEFDGERPAAAPLAIDPAAARYRDELRALRRLANLHDPAGRLPLPFPRSPRRRRLLSAAAAVAAGVAALVVGEAMRGPAAPRPLAPIAPRLASTAVARVSSLGGPSPEMAWHEWANQPARRPELAGWALWRSAGRHRPPGLEVLTLELVNAPSRSAARLHRAAAVRVASPGGRPRLDHRHHPVPDPERPS